MNKKLVGILSIGLCVLSLSACNSNTTPDVPKPVSTNQSSYPKNKSKDIEKDSKKACNGKSFNCKADSGKTTGEISKPTDKKPDCGLENATEIKKGMLAYNPNNHNEYCVTDAQGNWSMRFGDYSSDWRNN
jgi:hypothetical protein